MFKLKLLSIWCALLWVGQLHAQQFSNARFWGSSQGLKSTGVKVIEEDKDGMIWLGTYSGLVRFDGRSFVPFDKIIPGHKLGSEMIHNLAVLNYQLWVSSESGLYVFDVSDYSLKQIFLPDIKGNLNPKFRSRDLMKTLRNQILIGGSNGYLWLAKSDNDIVAKTNNLAGGKPFNPILFFANQGKDSVWFHSDNGDIYCFSTIKEELIYHHNLNVDLHHIFYQPGLGISIKRNIMMYRFDPEKRECKLWDKHPFDNANYILKQDNESFWLTRLGKELYFFDRANSFTNLSYVFSKIEDPNYKILTIVQFKNSLWVGTSYGLLRINVSKNKYPHIYATEPGVTDLVNTSVRGMCEVPDGDLIFAGYNGLFRISNNLSDKKITPLILDSIHNYIPYTLCYYKNKLWLGSEGGGIGEFNLKNNKLTRYVPNQYKHSHRAVYNIYIDSARNQFILATHAGLVRFDLATKKYVKIYINNSEEELNLAKISQIGLHNNYFYLASSQGLLICDRKFKLLKQLTFKGRQVYSLYFDKEQDEVWVGTGGDGVHILKNNKPYKHYSTQNGLTDNKIASIIRSGNKIYLGTYGGLSIFNIQTKTFINIQADQGLSSNEFNHGASFIDSKGQIFMGTVNGYNVVNGASQSANFYATHQPVLSSVFVLNGKKEQVIYNAKTLKNLFIPSDNKMVEFEFGMPDYNFPEKCMFAYKLVGIDKDWIQLGNRNYLRLSELKAGDYTLMVKACNSKGIWYAMQNNLHIEVDGPFYTKWWFISMVVLLVGGSVIAFYRIRIFQLKKLLALRLQISSDLHDEVGSILTAVGMQAELLQHTELGKNNDELKQISETSRKAVSNMRDVVWSIDSRNDKVKDLVDRMNDYLLLILEPTSIQFRFEKKIVNDEFTLDSITRQNAYLIFKEAINNIVKHAQATRIHINLTITNQYLEMVIENNGQYCNEHKNGSGMGLKNMQHRATQMKADFMLDEQNKYKLWLLKKW